MIRSHLGLFSMHLFNCCVCIGHFVVKRVKLHVEALAEKCNTCMLLNQPAVARLVT